MPTRFQKNRCLAVAAVALLAGALLANVPRRPAPSRGREKGRPEDAW